MSPDAAFPTPSLDEWRAAVARDAKTATDTLSWQADEDVTVPALATRADLEGLPHLAGWPGCAPFVRGGEALQAPFALPVHLHEPKELATLPQELSLARSVLHLGPAFANKDALDQLCAIARARGGDPRQLRATIALDPHQKLLRQEIAGPALDARLASAAELMRHASRHAPMVRTLLVATRWFQHEGASLVLESACALASGIDALRALERHGIAPDLAAPHIAFRFAVTCNLPVELARLRIVRGLWAKVVRAFGIVHKSALQMHLEAETSPVTSTLRDPHTNLVRSAIQSVIAALAGCETLTVHPFDARTHAWNEVSARLARNQQRILAHEARLDRIADPCGGSYAIELLTDRVGRAIWKRVQQIESEGGLCAALARGTLRATLAAHKDARRARLRDGRETLVGTSKFAQPPHEKSNAPEPALWHASDDHERGFA